MNKNHILSTQRGETAKTWNNNIADCSRLTAIDQIALAMTRRANNVRFYDETEYNRLMSQAEKLNTVSVNELYAYANDLGITILKLG